MPIEIIELTVRATVSETRAEGQMTAGSQSDGKSQEQISDRESIVREAVDKVLDILHRKEER